MIIILIAVDATHSWVNFRHILRNYRIGRAGAAQPIQGKKSLWSFGWGRRTYLNSPQSRSSTQSSSTDSEKNLQDISVEVPQGQMNNLGQNNSDISPVTREASMFPAPNSHQRAVQSEISEHEDTDHNCSDIDEDDPPNIQILKARAILESTPVSIETPSKLVSKSLFSTHLLSFSNNLRRLFGLPEHQYDSE